MVADSETIVGMQAMPRGSLATSPCGQVTVQAIGIAERRLPTTLEFIRMASRLARIEATLFQLADIQLPSKIMRYNAATVICSYQVPSSVLGDWLHIVMLPCNNGSRG